MPPVHRLRSAVVGNGIALVRHCFIAVFQLHYLCYSRARIREDSRAARVRHPANLQLSEESLHPRHQIINVQVALAVFAQVQVKTLSAHNHTVGRSRVHVMHTVNDNIAQHSVTLTVNTLAVVTDFQAFLKGDSLLCRVLLHLREKIISYPSCRIDVTISLWSSIVNSNYVNSSSTTNTTTTYLYSVYSNGVNLVFQFS